MDHVSGGRRHTEAQIIGLARRQYGMIHRQQALTAGMTRRAIDVRLANGEWARAHHGVYRLRAVPRSDRQALVAACLAAATGAVASHRAAAGLWGLDGCSQPPVEITIPSLSRRSLRAVTIHRTRLLVPGDVTEVDGIPVTRVPRTIVDLAAVVAPEVLEAAVDSALREGLTSVPYLLRRLGATGSKGRTGTTLLQRLLEDRRTNRPAESVKELEVVRLLTAAGLPPPERQYELWVDGLLIARFDHAYPEPRIAMEYDSYRHHFGRQAWARDHTRHNAAVAQDWLVFHLTGDALKAQVEAVARAYARRWPVLG